MVFRKSGFASFENVVSNGSALHSHGAV